MAEKKITETTTKTKNDVFGNPKEQKTVTKEKKSDDTFGDQEETTETTERIEKR